MLSGLIRGAALLALAEFDKLGRAAFLAEHGFGEARAYFLVHSGRRNDSKAISGWLAACSRADGLSARAASRAGKRGEAYRQARAH